MIEAPTPATPEQNAAYVAGLCIDCRQRPHSAGRPRCNGCHAVWWAKLTQPGTVDPEAGSK
jgi:hypothetical protein